MCSFSLLLADGVGLGVGCSIADTAELMFILIGVIAVPVLASSFLTSAQMAELKCCPPNLVLFASLTIPLVVQALI